MIAALLALLLAGPPPLAVSQGSEVWVWRSDRLGWRLIYRCHEPMPVGRARLAWAGSELFIACPKEPMARWQPGWPGGRLAINPVLAARRPDVLGSGQNALFFAEAGAVWRYRPDLNLVERLDGAPEWPLQSVAETPGGLMVCGKQQWLWRRGGWTLVKPRSSTGFSQL